VHASATSRRFAFIVSRSEKNRPMAELRIRGHSSISFQGPVRGRLNHGGSIENLFVAVLFVGILLIFGAANAADECGPGCHSAPNGGCVVDGWGTGEPVRNECPAGAQPRPPGGEGYVWRPRYRACFEK
jgi:hypothetical protein